MTLSNVVQDVEESGGMCHITLGALRDAYLEDHPGRDRKNLSEGLVEEIRRELADRNCLLWPLEMNSHRQGRNTYVINKGGKVGHVLQVLGWEPNRIGPSVLHELLDKPSGSARMRTD